MKHDDDLDARVRALASDYNAPDRATDTDALFARIQAARAAQETPRTVRRITPRHRSFLLRAAAIAAVLVIGIAVGRWSTPMPASDPVDAPQVATRSQRSTVHAAVTRDYLLRTQTLLTEFRTAAASPTPESAMPGVDTGTWAGSLLMETRLLLDSPVADSPELTRLLRDLELILAEIAQLSDGADDRERREIQRSLEERGVLFEIRNAVPAKSGRNHI